MSRILILETTPSGFTPYYSGAYTEFSIATGAGKLYQNSGLHEGFVVGMTTNPTKLSDELSTLDLASITFGSGVEIGTVDVRGSGDNYFNGITKAADTLDPSTTYHHALYAQLTGSAGVGGGIKTGIVGSGANSTDFANGNYSGIFTTDETVYNFSTTYNTGTQIGSGVHADKSLSIGLSVVDRTNVEIFSQQELLANPFISGIHIDILNSNGTTAQSGFQSGFKDVTFVFSEQDNEQVFGSYTRNFGVQTRTVSDNGFISTGKFFLYGNRIDISRIRVTDGTGQFLDENTINFKAPNTGLTNALPETNRQKISDANISGQIQFQVKLEDKESRPQTISIYGTSGDIDSLTLDSESLLRSFDLKFNPLNIYSFSLSQEDNIVANTDYHFKFVPEGFLGTGETWTVGPYRIQASELATDNPIMPNVSDQALQHNIGIGTTSITESDNKALVVYAEGTTTASIAVAGTSVADKQGNVGIRTNDPGLQFDAANVDKANVAATETIIDGIDTVALAGSGHFVSGNANVIAGGQVASISGGNLNFIGGGTGINVDHSSFSSSIGGRNNDIFSGNFSIIGGGLSNLISGVASESHVDKVAIVGGESNKVISAPYSFIGAGNSNLISGTNSLYSTIIGGGSNKIKQSQFASILGGDNNTIEFANHSVSAGNYSKVKSGHAGAFVFSDSRTSLYESTGGNTLNLRFESGVFVDTDSGIYINGNPVMTGASDEDTDTLQTVTDRGATTTNLTAFNNGISVSKAGQGAATFSRSDAGTVNVSISASNGDSELTFMNLAAEKFTLGNDGTNNSFRIAEGGALGTNDRFVILNGGNVGIGTNNPSTVLDVSGAYARINGAAAGFAEVLRLQRNGGNYYSVGLDNSRVNFVYNSQTTANSTLTIDGGNTRVGIGTHVPDRPLHVNAGTTNVVASFESTDAGAYLSFSDDSTTDDTYVRLGAIGDEFQFFAGGGERVRIDSAGFVGIGTNNPQRELEIHGAGNVFARITASTDSDSAGLELNNNGNAIWTLKADDTASDSFKITHDSVGTALTIDTSKNTTFNGDVLGTGDGNRITNNGTPYLLSGDAGGGGSDTLQDVTDRGATTTNSILVTGANIQAYGTGIFGLDGSDLVKVSHTAGAGVIDCLDDNLIIKTSSAERISINPNGSESLTVSSAGNVGIGSNNPANLLDIVSSASSTQTVRFRNANHHAQLQIQANNSYGSYLQFRDDTNRYWLESNANDKLFFRPKAVGSSEASAITFDETGRVGIGTTEPTEKLEVNPDTDVSAIIGKAHVGYIGNSDHAGFSHVDFATSSNYALKQNNLGNTFLNCKTAGTIAFNINNSTIAAFDNGGDFQVDTDTLFVDASADRVGINDTTPSYPLDVVGTIRTADSNGGGLKGLNSTRATTIEGFFANVSTEDYGFQNAMVANDLAGFSAWQGISIATSGLYKTRGGSAGSYTYSNEAGTGDFDNIFSNNNVTFSCYPDAGPDGTGVSNSGSIELYFDVEPLRYSAQVGVIFGGSSFKPAHVKIEYLVTGLWRTAIHDTDLSETAVIGRLSPNGGGNGVTGLRYSFAGNQAASIGSIRLNHFYAADYAMGDDRDYGGAYGIDKYYDGRHHATLRPVVSGGADLGTTSKRYGNSYINYARFTNAVGIGTDTLTYGLNVVSNSDILANFKSNDNKASLLIQDNDSAGYVSVESNRLAIGSQNGLNTGNLNILLDNGYVGIGTHNPSKSLHVSGDDVNGELIKLEGDASYGATIQYGRSVNYLWRAGIGGGSSTNSKIPTSYWGIEDVTSSNTPSIVCRPVNQYVGIKNTNPQYELDVSGEVAGTGVGSRITLGGVPYLLSGDAAASLTLQDVTDNGNSTTQPITVDAITGTGDLSIIKTDPKIILYDDASANTDPNGEIIFKEVAVTDGNFAIRYNGANDRLEFNSPQDLATGVLTITRGFGNVVNQKVGVNTVAPKTNFHVLGSGNTQGGVVTVQNSNTSNGSYCGIQFINSTVNTPRSAIFAMRTGGAYDADLTFHTTTANELNSTDYSTTTERMRITHDGTVGIGTNAPARKFEVSESSSSIVSQFKSTAGTSAFISIANTTATADQIRFGSIGNDLVLSTNYTERFRITSAGNVGIGTDAPDSILHLDSDGATVLTIEADNDNNDEGDEAAIHLLTDGGLRTAAIAGGNATYETSASGNFNALNLQSETIRFHTAPSQDFNLASEKMRLTSSGNLGIGTTNPQYNLEIYSGDRGLGVSSTGTAKLVLEGDINNVSDVGDMDASIEFLHDAGLFGYRISSHNYAGLNALNFADKKGDTYTDVLHLGTGGNVGIGTDDPETKLHVQFSGTNGLRLRSTDDDCYMYLSNSTANRNNIIYFGDNSSNFAGMIQYNHQYDYMAFRVDGGERVRISADGDMGIGTQAPTGKLDVEGVIVSRGGTITGGAGELSRTDAAMVIKEDDNIYTQVNATNILRRLIGKTSAGVINIGDSNTSIISEMAFHAGNTVNAKYTFHSGSTEIVRIESDGKVGIGTDSPDSLLHLESASSPTLRLKDTTYNNILLAYAQDAESHVGTYSSHDLVLDSNSSERIRITSAGNVGIGTNSPSNALDVVGHFSATSKSFLIDHPTKENKKLQYASLEGPENGVYVRGTTNSAVIELPDYWSALVHEDSITVVLTPIGKKQDLYIKSKSPENVMIGGVEGSYDYVVYGERKDIDRLEIEPDGN